MVITVVADSLAMPRREEGGSVLFSQTWPVQLQTMSLSHTVKPIHIAMHAQRARDSRSLNKSGTRSDALKFVDSELVVLQIGIVDCAPRIISEHEKRNLNRFYVPKAYRDRIIENRKAHRHLESPEHALDKVYVKPEAFRKNVEQFRDYSRACGNRKMLVIPILGDTKTLEKNHPGYKSNIVRYNDILSSLQDDFLNLISMEDNLDNAEFYVRDAYHLSSLGHQKIAEAIFQEIYPNF